MSQIKNSAPTPRKSPVANAVTTEYIKNNSDAADHNIASLFDGGAPTSAGFGSINHDAANRYSTYTQSGLPPGPIANPGEASLRAVLAPASTRYFYFVAKGGGRHTFSETLGAHNDAIRRARDD